MNGRLYVPSYTNDIILIYHGENIDTAQVDIELDAPSGVDLMDNRMIIADFYNHRLVYNDGQQWRTIGEAGSENGQLNYPTDVQFHKDKIYVADAYNNRAQVFDLSGQHIMTLGSELDLNAATGIFVTDQEIFLTDFENDRVVVFDHSGVAQQFIDTGLNKPTDVIIINDQLWILNYMGKYITSYSR
jgi:DNA-binding beta-propeller fold protein YncE